MNAEYLISIILVGLVLSGSSCCIDRSQDIRQESVSDTSQTLAEDVPDASAGELTESEMDDLESDLAELEAFLGEIDAIDSMAEVNESTFT